MSLVIKIEPADAALGSFLLSITKTDPFSDSLAAQFLCEVQKLAFIYNYRLLFFQSFSSSKKETKFINQVNDGSTDGVIVLSKWNKNMPYKNQTKQLGIPTIVINTEDINDSNSNLKSQVSKHFNDLLLEIN